MGNARGVESASLMEFTNTVRRYKWLFIGFPLVTTVLASIYVFSMQRPMWEGTAVLEIGAIGQPYSMGKERESGQMNKEHALVEPAQNVVTRMSDPSFAENALIYAKVNPVEYKEVLAVYMNTIRVAQAQGVGLVEVKLGGYSRKVVKELIEASVANLQEVHSGMMADSIELVKKQIKVISEDILDSNREIALLRNKLNAAHNWNTFDANLAANILQSKSNELRDMMKQRIQLEDQISPTKTYTTRLLGKAYVPEEPKSQRRGLIIFMAFMLGVAGAVLIAFVHNLFVSYNRRLFSE